jgi:hypothetical protein
MPNALDPDFAMPCQTQTFERQFQQPHVRTW